MIILRHEAAVGTLRVGEQQEHRAVEGGAEADDIRIVFHLRTGHDDHHQHRYTGDQVEQNLSFQGVILFFSAMQDSP